MIALLKAEFRKLFTVRSTYVISGFALLLIMFLAFYVGGFRLTTAELQNPLLLAGDVTSAASTVGIFVALIAILLMTHEYRYNTIMYTLTSSNSRSKVLFAKFLALGSFAVVFMLAIAILSPAMSYLGIVAHGHTLGPQTVHYGDLLWRSLFFGWGYGIAGLLIAALVRNQVGAIAALFVVPGAIEQLLGLLLKHNAQYLPFMSLGSVISSNVSGSGGLSPSRAALVFTGYLIIGWIIAWLLFLRRDAN